MTTKAPTLKQGLDTILGLADRSAQDAQLAEQKAKLDELKSKRKGGDA